MKGTVKNYKYFSFGIILILGVFVFVSTFRLLTQPALSAVRNADCSIVEHTHSPECYKTCDTPGTTVLICGSYYGNSKVSHIHDPFCYNFNNDLICPLAEYEHRHSDECYDENMAVICGFQYHQHSRECLHIIEKDESFDILCCGHPAHIHNESCYPAPPATEEITDEIVPVNNADITAVDDIAEDDEYYYYGASQPFALFSMEGDGYADEADAEELNNENSVILDTEHIDYAIFQYGEYVNGDIVWHDIENNAENIPANAPVLLKIHYQNIDKSDILSKGNRIVYPGIPSWMIVDHDKTGDIHNENGDLVANLKVIGNNAVITFDEDYLDSLPGDNSHLSGSFSMQGNLKWRELIEPETPPSLPLIDLNFKFEDDLISKYGDFEVTKTGENKVEEIADENGKIHSYLKYQLKIKSKETEYSVNNITITDTLSAPNRDINNVIKAPGYVKIPSEATAPGNSADSLNPYETITNADDSTPGKIQLENNNLKWTIVELKPNEERTLVYYVELNDKYVGSASAGTLRNEAEPVFNNCPREKVHHDFTPKANVSVNKTSCEVNLSPGGSGTLSYKVEVTADSQNSYTITNAAVKDEFQWRMDEFVNAGEDITVSIQSNKSNTVETKTVKIQRSGFELPIEKLEPGEKLTITYSVPVTGVYSVRNGDFNFKNYASFVGGKDTDKLMNNHTFGGNDAQTYIYHNQWTRKLNGTVVDKAKTINFGTDTAYNSNGSQSSDTGFTVPANAQEYIVIVNEDGEWNMSGAAFKDSFNDTRIAYTGYLKIEEFDRIYNSGIHTNDITTPVLLSDLNNHPPNQTIWVNIDGQNSFDITPTKLGLDDASHVYRLTYYAAIKSDYSDVKSIYISNNFSLTGTIGIGDETLYLGGIGMTVSSTITGSANYSIEKSALFHEKRVYTGMHGEIYWIIRAEGTLPKDLQLQDRDLYNTTVPADALVGVYLGDKDAKLSGFTSYNDLKQSLDENMTPYNIGTRGRTYSLVGINSVSDLDGKEYAIFSHGDAHSGYIIDNPNNTFPLPAAKINSKISFPNNSVPLTDNKLPQMWHFQRITGNDFYVYYTDNSDNKQYLNIVKETNPRNQNNPYTAKISTTPMMLTITKEDNEIIIHTNGDDTYANGGALNWFGGNNANDLTYDAWKNNGGKNNYHYLAVENTSSMGDFSSDNNGNIYVNHQIDIPEDQAIYMIVRTKPNEALSGDYAKSYKNQVGVIDKFTGKYDMLSEAEYIYKPAKAVKKEPMVAAYYDDTTKKWTIYSVNPSNDRNTEDKIKNYCDNYDNKITSKNGSGLYMEWLINVNWDGTLEGDYILTDYLDKDKYEPVLLRGYWVTNPDTKYFKPALDDNENYNDWEYKSIPTHSNHDDIPFYYNKQTGEIKVGVGNLHTGGVNDHVVNMQLICRVIDPDIIFTGKNSTIPNSFSLETTDGDHITDGTVYHQIKPAYLIDKKAAGVGDTGNDKNPQHHTNKMNYEININPNKENFMANSDILPELIDEMSNTMELVGDIEVYEKNNGTENLLKNIPYTLVKGDTTTKITISNLPDQTHLVIKYSTRVNAAPGVNAKINNYAYWKGYSKPNTPQHSETFSFTLTGDVSAQNNPTVVIRKVDMYDSSISLSGAEFQIRMVDNEGKISDNDPITLTTDENGLITIDSHSTKQLEYNTVYQLKETKAPTDYVLDDTPRYFMIINSNEHNYPINDGKMMIDDKAEQVTIDYAGQNGIDMTMNISNAKGKITVNKIFRDENGNEIASPENGSYNFGLYYSDPAVHSDVKPVQILTIVYKNRIPSYLLDGEKVNLPEFTKARANSSDNYVYELDGENKPVKGNDRAYINGRFYNVSYNGNPAFVPNNNTNTQPTVTITNVEYKIKLPMTGGKGIFWYYKNAMRVFMICLTVSVIVIYLKKRRIQA